MGQVNIRSIDYLFLHLRSLKNGTTTDRMVVWSLNISKPQNGHSEERCARRCILLLDTGCSDYEQKYELFTRNETGAGAKYFQDSTLSSKETDSACTHQASLAKRTILQSVDSVSHRESRDSELI